MLRSEQDYVRKEAYLEHHRSTFLARGIEQEQRKREEQLRIAEHVWMPSAVRKGLAQSSGRQQPLPCNPINDAAIQQIDTLKVFCPPMNLGLHDYAA